MGILSEATQARLQELEAQKKAIKDAIETEKAKKALIEDDTSIQKFFVDKIYVYDYYIVVTCYMKNYDYIEDYGGILNDIERDKKKAKKKDKKKSGKGVRQGCAQAHHQKARKQAV